MGNSLVRKHKEDHKKQREEVKKFIKYMILSDFLYRQKFIFEWCNYSNDPETYINNIVNEANEYPG